MAKYPSLEGWSHKRIVTVELDDDTKVDFRLPDLGLWIAQGKIPNPLRPMAEAVEYGAVNPEHMTDEDRMAYYDLRDFVVATHLVKPNLMAKFQDADEATEWVRENVPPMHRDLLWLRALHIVPEQIAASILDLQSFRDEPAGERSEGDSSPERAGS